MSFNCFDTSDYFNGLYIRNSLPTSNETLTQTGPNSKNIFTFIISLKKSRGLVISGTDEYHIKAQFLAPLHSPYLQRVPAVVQSLLQGYKQPLAEDWLLSVFLIHSPARGKDFQIGSN